MEIKEAIKNGASDLGLDINTQGKGLVDALKTIELLGPVSTPTPIPTPTPTPSPSLKQRGCLQVITPAVNPKTGVCKNFTNSCIPSGWVKVKDCAAI